MKQTMFAALALIASTAIAGVDGGNPKMASFFNMALDYRLAIPDGLSAEPVGQESAVKVEGPLTYRNIGHYIIAHADPSLAAGESICKRKAIAGSNATLFWIGRDCRHPYFKLRFNELGDSTHALKFP